MGTRQEIEGGFMFVTTNDLEPIIKFLNEAAESVKQLTLLCKSHQEMIIDLVELTGEQEKRIKALEDRVMEEPR